MATRRLNFFPNILVKTVIVFAALYAEQSLAQTNTYRSAIDESLNIKSVTVAPLVDNVGGIYSTPLTGSLEEYFTKEHYWNLNSNTEKAPVKPEELDERPERVKAILKTSNSDALIAGRISKGPSGISIKLSLFLKSDGYLAAQESVTDYSRFELADLKMQITLLVEKLRQSLPYYGTLLSRKSQIVTFNLGTQSGIKEGDPISVIQIIKLQRHPKFKFIVGAEKEIIGRIKVTKVDEALSFGLIELEREAGSIQPGMKLLPVNFVKYPNAVGTEGKPLQELNDRKDSPVAFGDNPKEWVPKHPPTFGKAGFLFGVGTYNISNAVVGSGAVEDSKNFVPSMHIRGEMWLTQNWQLGLNLKQFVFSAANTLSGSSPSSINVSGLQTDLNVGYNVLMTDSFFGPKFQLSLGYTKYSATVGDSSPTAYTSASFSGINLGIGGEFPVGDSKEGSVGGRLNYFMFPAVDESPVSSGSTSTASIGGFSLFGDYRWTESTHLTAELMSDSFEASFGGEGTRTPAATSSSHSIFTLAFGVNYYF